MRTLRDITRTTHVRSLPTLQAPSYRPSQIPNRSKVMMAVESMRDHMTDEGWQIALALESCSYKLVGHGIMGASITDTREILDRFLPGTLVIQDKREWDVSSRDFRDARARFTNIEILKDRDDIFKLTILKDAHNKPPYHSDSAAEMGVHAWIIYYHPTLVKHFAPYVREEHLVRTYHTLDWVLVPKWWDQPTNPANRPYHTIISGALGGAYPLRTRLVGSIQAIPEMIYLPHPGYHRKGCATPRFLHLLAKFKVAICTSSRYGYALRKIIEATACGCKVISDLPTDEVLPHIDGNIERVDPNLDLGTLRDMIRHLAARWDPEVQREYSRIATAFYDYRAIGRKLDSDIERVKKAYNQEGKT